MGLPLIAGLLLAKASLGVSAWRAYNNDVGFHVTRFVSRLDPELITTSVEPSPLVERVARDYPLPGTIHTLVFPYDARMVNLPGGGEFQLFAARPGGFHPVVVAAGYDRFGRFRMEPALLAGQDPRRVPAILDRLATLVREG
ncbi:hypothetical protein [Defluviimonas salinarum]|uniref:Uncharacterized protein n=1 Tax=Defluviimonas salinarum TaxID=2992147 RepID=A0ABT3J9E6_9RHOB|nr:hypothetical protein [Defluviimonas salinarum]MCW3784306.1 hypothetical protein [Defluviimonas salinarum]